MNLSDRTIAAIRTAVPVAIGTALTWLGAWLTGRTGRHVDLTGYAAVIDGVALTLVTSAYYWGVRLLQKKFPSAGWLLGHPATPTYKNAGMGAVGGFVTTVTTPASPTGSVVAPLHTNTTSNTP